MDKQMIDNLEKAITECFKRQKEVKIQNLKMQKQIEDYLLELGFNKSIIECKDLIVCFETNFILELTDIKIRIWFNSRQMDKCEIETYYALEDIDYLYDEEENYLFNGWVYNFKHFKYILLALFNHHQCKDIFNLNHEVLI